MNFKKLTSVLAAGLLSFTCATAVSADFSDSSTNQGATAPETVTLSDGTTAGVVVSKSTPALNDKTSVMRNYPTAGAYISAVLPEIDTQLEAAGINVDDLTMKAAIDLEVDVPEGVTASVPVTVPGVGAEDDAYVIHWVDGTTPELLTEENGGVKVSAGTVTITSDSFSPFAIFVIDNEPGGAGEKIPGTGNYSNIALWGGVLVVAVAAAGVVLFEKKRKAN